MRQILKRLRKYRQLGLFLACVLFVALAVWAARHVSEPEARATYVIGYLAGAVAVVTLGAALTAIHSSSKAAERADKVQMALVRRQTTYQHIARTEADKDFLAARRDYRAAKQAGHIEQWAEVDKLTHATTAALLLVLNDLELVAMSIKSQIMDNDMFLKWNRTSVVEQWHTLYPFVRRFREVQKSRRAWSEAQAMAQEWDWDRQYYKPDGQSPYFHGSAPKAAPGGGPDHI